MKPFNRISLILLGAAVYWIGYCGFFTHLQSPVYASLCLVLVISGLWVAGTNSTSLYRGR